MSRCILGCRLTPCHWSWVWWSDNSVKRHHQASAAVMMLIKTQDWKRKREMIVIQAADDSLRRYTSWNEIVSKMNRDLDVDDSESIRKCQKSIFYMLIDNVMLTERKRRNPEVWKCSARTVDGMHTTKNMGWVLNICTHKQVMGGTVWDIHRRRAAREQRGDRCWLLAVSC